MGSAIGNGCTSGHGIAGNARLSPRSLAYTLTFMAAGMASATLSGAATALGVLPVAPKYTVLGAAEGLFGGLVMVISSLVFFLLGVLGGR